MHKAEDYTYKVFYSGEDSGFVGMVTEFPSLSFIADSQNDAFLGIVDTVRHAIDILLEDGSSIPSPIGAKKYSGKIVLRMTPEKHRELAAEAAEQNVSLNRLISSRL